MMMNRSNMGIAMLLTIAAAFVASAPSSTPWSVVVSSLALVVVVLRSALRPRPRSGFYLPLAIVYCAVVMARLVLHIVLALAPEAADVRQTLAPFETVASIASYVAFAALILTCVRAPEVADTTRRYLVLAVTCWGVGWVVLVSAPFSLLGQVGWAVASSVAGVLVAFSLVLLAAVSLTSTTQTAAAEHSATAA